MSQGPHPTPRAAIVGVAAASLVLVTIALTYWLTVEPAPEVRIEWRADVTAEQRTALERQLRLVGRRPGDTNEMAYDLLRAWVSAPVMSLERTA